MSLAHEFAASEQSDFRMPYRYSFLELDTQNPDQLAAWQTFVELEQEASRDPNQARLLLDYAAHDGPSLTARAFAYDAGVSIIADAVEVRNYRNIEPSDETLRLYDHLRSTIPEYFAGAAMRDLDIGDGPFVYRAHYALFEQVACSEAISYQNIQYPDSIDMRYGITHMQTTTPEATSMLIGQFIDGKSSDIDHLSPLVARDVLATALSLSSKPFGEVTARNDGDIAEFARLWHLTQAGGEEHKAPIDFLYGLPEAEKSEYANVLNSLYQSAEGLTAAFPYALGEAVTNGARGLIADAVFAVKAHIEGGKQTHTNLALRNGGELAVDFEDDEPLEVLTQLDVALRTLHAAATDENFRTVMATEPNGNFQIDRFINIATGQPSKVSLYTRPYESHTFDPEFEYGRHGKGVEASISYKIQVGDETKLLPLNKFTPNEDIISVRLDREHDDVISLDVGSVLGDPASIGTKIGRLLGWGNSLRTSAKGQDASLNHVKDALDQQYGGPFEFASLTKQMRDKVDAKRATEAEFRAYEALARRLFAAELEGAAALGAALATAN